MDTSGVGRRRQAPSGRRRRQPSTTHVRPPWREAPRLQDRPSTCHLQRRRRAHSGSAQAQRRHKSSVCGAQFSHRHFLHERQHHPVTELTERSQSQSCSRGIVAVVCRYNTFHPSTRRISIDETFDEYTVTIFVPPGLNLQEFVGALIRSNRLARGGRCYCRTAAGI